MTKSAENWSDRDAPAPDIRTLLRERQDRLWLRVSVATGAVLKKEGYEVTFQRREGKQIAWARRREPVLVASLVTLALGGRVLDEVRAQAVAEAGISAEDFTAAVKAEFARRRKAGEAGCLRRADGRVVTTTNGKGGQK